MPTPRPALLIADVEQATGIARATLRVWEQRYGFPSPGRSTSGERTYPLAQVRQLKTIQQLVQAGYKPREVLTLPAAELQKLARSARRNVAAAVPADPMLQLLREHEPDALLSALRRIAGGLGLQRFVAHLAGLNRTVGEAWQCGQLQVFEEHAYVEAVQTVLRHAILNLPALPAKARPRVVLATAGEELHGLGLLMAHAMFALEGCRCVSLGVRVPLAQVAAAAESYNADIVALSFSAHQRTRKTTWDLQQLRKLLPASVELWVGGGSPAIGRASIEDVTVFTDISAIAPAVADFRERHGIRA